jgi:hypothetical protein
VPSTKKPGLTIVRTSEKEVSFFLMQSSQNAAIISRFSYNKR